MTDEAPPCSDKPQQNTKPIADDEKPLTETTNITYKEGNNKQSENENQMPPIISSGNRNNFCTLLFIFLHSLIIFILLLAR